MSGCTPIAVASAEFCELRENEAGGLKQVVSIFLHDDVATYPAYEDTPPVESPTFTAIEGKLRAAAAIVMKASKFPIQLPAILESGGLQIRRKGRRVFENELKLRVQNTAHNRAVIHQLAKNRFSAVAPESEGQNILLGQSDGVSTGFLCRVADDGILAEFGQQYDSDKFVEVTIIATPKHAVVYPFAIAYS